MTSWPWLTVDPEFKPKVSAKLPPRGVATARGVRLQGTATELAVSGGSREFRAGPFGSKKGTKFILHYVNVHTPGARRSV